MRTLFFVVTVFIIAVSSREAIAQDCLQYGPTVSLTGRLQSRVFPGPPNYQSIRKGDRKETAWLLTLGESICTAGNDPQGIDVPETNVRDVQLVITNDADWKLIRRLAGRRATVSGTLFHAHTGHHRTKVLMDVASIDGAAAEHALQPQKNKAPTTLASGWSRPDYVAVDATNVYLVSNEKKLVKVSKSGGKPVVLFELTGENNINGVAVDQSGVYVLTENKLLRLDAGTGAATELATTHGSHTAMVLDESNVYWIGAIANGKNYQLIKVEKKGGTPVPLSAEILAPQSGGLAVDQTSAYWLDYADDLLRSVSKEGGTPKTLIKFPGGQAVAVDEQYVYAGGASGKIMKLDKNGGAPQMLGPERPEQVTFMLVDENSLYYSAGDRIMKVSKNGGRATVVARKGSGSFRFTIDACCVYWTDYETGHVMKIAK